MECRIDFCFYGVGVRVVESVIHSMLMEVNGLYIMLVIDAVEKIIISLRLSSMVLSGVDKIFIVSWFRLVTNQIMY